MVSLVERAVPVGNSTRGHHSADLGLDPRPAADAGACCHDVVTEVRQRADQCPDVDGTSGLSRQINARIKAQIENLHRFLRAETA